VGPVGEQGGAILGEHSQEPVMNETGEEVKHFWK
jgi:hypothetical protein